MMRFLIVLLIAFVPIIAEGQTQECLDVTPSTTPSDHGSFVEGSKDSLQAVDNASALNAAVSSVGDGGAVCLPEGTYYLLPDTNPEGGTDVIEIERDSISLWGAGRDVTNLRTRSFADSADTDGDDRLEYWRADGLQILSGNSSGSNPYQDIVLRDFTIEGRGRDDSFSGYTGNFGFGNESPDNWDTSHKGLNLGFGATVIGDILIENVAVRHFRGEQIYQGGQNTQQIVVRNIISEITNASTYNAIGDSTLIEDSYFGKSKIWYEGAMNWNRTIHIRNNVFEDAQDGGVELSGGDSTAIDLQIYDNTVRDCNKTFVRSTQGPRGAPARIYNNTLEGCSLFRKIAGGGSGENNSWISNFIIEENSVEPEGWPAFSTSFGGNYADVVIRNNDFTFQSTHPIFLLTPGSKRRMAVVDNTYVAQSGEVESPRRPGGGALAFEKRPLIRGNSYSPSYKVSGRDSGYNFDSDQSNPNVKLTGRVSDVDMQVADSIAFVGGSADGQISHMALSGSGEARFYADPKPSGLGNGKYKVEQDFTATGPDTLTFWWDGSQHRMAHKADPFRLTKTGGTGTVTGDTLTGQGGYSTNSGDNGHLRSMALDTTQVATDTMGVEGYLNVQDGPQPFSMAKLRLAKGDSTDSDRAAVECSRVGYCRLSVRKNGTLTKYNWQVIPKDTYMRIRTDGQYVWAEHDADEDGVMEVLEINNNGTTSKTDDRVALDLGSTPHAGVGCVSGQSGVEATCRARNTTVASY